MRALLIVIHESLANRDPSHHAQIYMHMHSYIPDVSKTVRGVYAGLTAKLNGPWTMAVDGFVVASSARVCSEKAVRSRRA